MKSLRPLSAASFPATVSRDHRAQAKEVVCDLYLIAGVDGAGKSSIGGATFRAHGVDYFDPDAATLRLMRTDPKLGRGQTDGLAAQQNERLLERAIAEGQNHAFETGLDAHHLPGILAGAASRGVAIHVWYIGLSSPELHLRRVRTRGDHEIDEAEIRRCYRHSRLNLIELLPHLAALRLYDNSAEADLARGVAPRPLSLLQLDHGRVVGPDNLSATPEWARPIVVAALKSAS